MTCRIVLLAVLLCGSSSERTAAQGLPVRVDAPVPLAGIVHPETMRGLVAPEFEGHPLLLEHQRVDSEGGLTAEATFVVDDRSTLRVRLWSTNGPPPAQWPHPGQETQHVHGWPASVFREDLHVWVSPTRRAIVSDTPRGRALLDLVDLDAFAAHDEPLFAAPRSGTLWETRRAASDESRRLASRRLGAAVVPDRLAGALPDTAGLGLPPRTSVTTRGEWQLAYSAPEDPSRQPTVVTGATLLITLPSSDYARASVTAYVATGPDSGASPAELNASRAVPGTIRAGGLVVQRWPPDPAHSLRLRYSVSFGPGRWAVATGPDTTLALRLLASVRATAFDGLRPELVPLARTQYSVPENPGGGVLTTGLLPEADGRVSVHTGEYRAWQPDGSAGVLGTVTLPRPFSFRLPDGWLVTGTILLHCTEEWQATLAVLTRAPLDPCGLRSYSGSPAEVTVAEYARASPVVLVQALRPAALAPLAWLETWTGFAESLLPVWSAGFAVSRPPQREGGATVTLATTGPGLHVEAAYVQVSDWLLGVVGVGPTTDAAALRSAVAAVAASLQPAP